MLVLAVFALALIAAIAPVIAALAIARHQHVTEQRERARSLAGEIVRRGDIGMAQVRSVLRELEASSVREPCSDESIRRMAGAVLENEQIQGVGYAAGDRLICTSAGVLDRPLDLGPPQIRSLRGFIVRTSVRLPTASTVGLIAMAERHGYVVFLHPRLLVDMPLANDREAIGAMDIGSMRLINARGPVDAGLLRRVAPTRPADFVAGRRLVAIQPSTTGDFAGFAILPMSDIGDGMWRYLVILLPIGLICGGALMLLVRELMRIENDLGTIAKRALRAGEFYLRYQPLVELETGRWIGAEALVRWHRPTGEEMRPDLFIPYLEEAGLIPLMTDKVFEMLAADMGESLGVFDDFYVTINVASLDLRGDRLAMLIGDLLSRTGSRAHHLAVEVTERGLVDAEDGRQALKAARDRGIRVALDDFGTGYSSLAYLQKFPLDYIKIDKSFVDSIATEAATSSVVAHIINMARDLELGIIAEGVETAEQARFLIERGVAHGQGWLFARPMPWSQLVAGLERQRASR